MEQTENLGGGGGHVPQVPPGSYAYAKRQSQSDWINHTHLYDIRDTWQVLR